MTIHRVEQITLDAQPQLGQDDVSKCLPSWIEKLCEKFEQSKGVSLSHPGVNALCHTLIAARVRAERLVAERDAAIAELAMIRGGGFEHVTESDVEAVEGEIGMGRGAWDMVNHRELLAACAKVLAGKQQADDGGNE